MDAHPPHDFSTQDGTVRPQTKDDPESHTALAPINVAKVITAFERTLMAGNSPYDRYLAMLEDSEDVATEFKANHYLKQDKMGTRYSRPEVATSAMKENCWPMASSTTLESSTSISNVIPEHSSKSRKRAEERRPSFLFARQPYATSI